MGMQEQGQGGPQCDFSELGPTTPGATPAAQGGPRPSSGRIPSLRVEPRTRLPAGLGVRALPTL